MKHRGMRVGLVLLFLAAAAAAGYEVLRLERQLGDAHAAERAFDELAHRLIRSVLELRSAQQAYVAAGQEQDYWSSKVASQIELATEQVSQLTALAPVARSQNALDAATGAIDNFGEMDARARDHTADGQQLQASDLIFTDGLELTETALEKIGSAHALEREAREATVRRLRLRQGSILAAVVGAAIVFMVLLLPGVRVAAAETAISELPVAADETRSRLGNLTMDAGPPESEPDDVAGETRIEGIKTAPLPPRAAPAPPAAPDLPSAAALCTDLGRVCNTEELPSLLKRAAELIDASGIVIWMSDQTGTTLHPVLVHGYPAQALARLGDIPCDGDNATAAAFRSAKIQVVNGDENSSGAIVAPLQAATGCIGVMAAEVRPGREPSEALQAIASIVAAQLATLVGGSSPEMVSEAKSESA